MRAKQSRVTDRASLSLGACLSEAEPCWFVHSAQARGELFHDLSERRLGAQHDFDHLRRLCGRGCGRACRWCGVVNRRQGLREMERVVLGSRPEEDGAPVDALVEESGDQLQRWEPPAVARRGRCALEAYHVAIDELILGEG